LTVIDSAAFISPTYPIPRDRRSLDGVLSALHGLVGSVDPAVVFASLVRACVPAVAAAAAIRTSSPTGPLHPAPGDSVWTPIDVESDGRYPEMHGVLQLRFDSGRPGSENVVVGQLVVGEAVALIDRARSAAETARLRAEVDALGRALDSSREIGIAMGIVMARHSLTAEQSFDLLRRVSQRRNQKLRYLALDVIATGQLDLPAGVTINGTDGRVPAPSTARSTVTSTAMGPATRR
jgi:hypothetical protein